LKKNRLRRLSRRKPGSLGARGSTYIYVRLAPQDLVGCHVAFGSSQSGSVSEYLDFVGFRHSGLDPESSLLKQSWIPAFAGMTEESGIPTGSQGSLRPCI